MGTLPPTELAQLNAALNAKESFIRGSPVVEKMGDVLGSIRGAPVLTAAQTNAAVSSGLWLLDPDSSGREAIGFTRGHEDGKQRGKTSPPSRSHPSLTTSRWRARRARSPTRTTARRWRERGRRLTATHPIAWASPGRKRTRSSPTSASSEREAAYCKRPCMMSMFTAIYGNLLSAHRVVE